MIDAIQKALDTHWLVFKKMYPENQVIVNERGIAEINPEYGKWLIDMKSQLVDFAMDICKEIKKKQQEL